MKPYLVTQQTSKGRMVIAMLNRTHIPLVESQENRLCAIIPKEMLFLFQAANN